MRWLLIGGVLVGGAIVTYFLRRDPQTLERIAAKAREAFAPLQQSQNLILEEVREVFREAMEEGQAAAARKMAELQERFQQLRQEPGALPYMEGRARNIS